MLKEALNRVRAHLENQDPNKQSAIRRAKELLAVAGVQDLLQENETVRPIAVDHNPGSRSCYFITVPTERFLRLF